MSCNIKPRQQRKPRNQRTFEVTIIRDNGTHRTNTYTLREANARFGREEFVEVLQGCMPNIVAVEL